MEFSEARDVADALARFVYVEDDGSARELTPGEAEYLATPFDPFDGNRPYVKWRYRSRTADRRLRGYLERQKLPAGMAVAPPPRQGPFPGLP